MGNQVQQFGVRSHRYQNILASRSFPLLFGIVCFLIIANTRCDSVGTTNENSNERHSLTSRSKAKSDPLSMLREIYLGQNSKIISMDLSPPGSDSVQKFHPNGRYGRRSVNNFVEPSAHVELGKLSNGESSGPLSSLLHNLGSARNGKLEAGNTRFADLSSYGAEVPNEISENVVSMEQELNKLLKCSYTGVSNLYWCGTSN